MPYRKRKHAEEARPAGESPAGAAPVQVHTSVTVEVSTYLLALSPLALGAVHLPSVAALLALACAGFVGLLWATRRQGHRIRMFPLGVLLLAAAGACLLQVLPLPRALLGLLSPGAAELTARVLEGTPLLGAWRPASLAPPATWLEVMKYLAYALALLTAVNYYQDRTRARRLLKAVAWSGFLVALTGFVHKLFAAETILGLYPIGPGTFFFSTFVNPNHLAGLLCLTAPVALGLALSARERPDRALYGFMGVVAGVGVFMTLSRGGMVAFGTAMLFLMAHGALRQSRKLKRVALAQGLAALVLLIAGYLAYDTIMRELRTLGDLEGLRAEVKVRVWGSALPLLRDFPALGIGRGAFATAFPMVNEVTATHTFTHPENLAVQAGVEWGPVLGALWLLGLLGVFALALRRARTSFSMAGALAGVFGVFLQNSADFSLEIAGVMMPCVLVLGVLTASPFSHAGPPFEWETRPRLGRRLAWGLAGLALALLVLGTWQAGAHALEPATLAVTALQDAAPAEPCDPSPLGQATCELLDSYPADYLPHLVLGRAALRARPPQVQLAVRHLERAMLLNPANARAHQLAGRALLLAGARDQALGEYRLAARHEPKTLPAVLGEVLKLTGDPDLALRATPDEAEAYLAAARFLWGKKLLPQAEEAARLALERNSTSLAALDLMGEMALAKGQLQAAEAHARQGMQIDPLHPENHDLLARALLAQGKPDQAEQALRLGLESAPDSALLAHRLVELYLQGQKYREAEELVDRMFTFAAPDDAAQARLFLIQARIKEARGMAFEARQAYRQAAEASPQNPAVQHQLGLAEARVGNWDEAERIFSTLHRLGYKAEEMEQRLAVVREARRIEQEGVLWKNLVKPEEK
ncbi:MAG TPA: tetratricopeptide repeat protein [Myxococcota bacterium]|nr:tetratricopeptide repeat protein [Myxococcota bacterium]HRY93153.1 tetratricopeptide repeat protein [Myxococcota bacterium]